VAGALTRVVEGEDQALTVATEEALGVSKEVAVEWILVRDIDNE